MVGLGGGGVGVTAAAMLCSWTAMGATMLPLLLLGRGARAHPAACVPSAPMAPLLYSVDYQTADHICCHNSHHAEHSGYMQSVRFFEGLNQSAVTTFFDSVCGLPLFRAPVGRSFAQWESESIDHGWPSFRTAETIGWVWVPSRKYRAVSPVEIARLKMGSRAAGSQRECADPERRRDAVHMWCASGAQPTRQVSTVPATLRRRLPWAV